MCLRKMCLMVWKRTFYGNVDLSTTCQCRQLRLNPLSTQINICCLMTNQTPALLVQRAPWTPAAVMWCSCSVIYFPFKKVEFWQLLLNAFIQFASHLANGTCGNSCSSDCVFFLMMLECSDWLPLSAFYQLSQHLSWPHLLPTAAIFR